MERIISLPNRDHRHPDKIELIKEQDPFYQFKLLPYEEYADFWRVIFSDDFIHAIDPPGGPYMEIGYFKINDLLLQEITRDKEGFKLTFKKI